MSHNDDRDTGTGSPAPDADEQDGAMGMARHASRRPRDLARRLANSRKGLWSIGVLSFFESTIIPVPLEVVLIPYMLARRDILWRIATVTLLGCLLGALVGYGIGYFVFDTLGTWIVEKAGWTQQFESTKTWFENNGFWAVLAIGVTPVPFQVAMLVAGVMKYPVLLFVAATVIARGIRYFGLALLVHLFGERAIDLWQRHKVPTAAALTAVVALLVVLNVTVL